MTEPLGISVSPTSLVAARAGAAPVICPAELTLGDQVWTGFVDRVGDPTPLVGVDGVAYRAEQLLALALAALADVDGVGLAAVAGVAVPAHWGPGRRDALRDALWGLPALAGAAAPPLLVSDATAALRSLQNDQGLPRHGVILVCDVSASGTSVTLADAAADYRQIGETARWAEFSTDAVDQIGIPSDNVSAVAALGDGESLLVVAQQLSEHLRLPVTMSAHPQLDAALGASLTAARQLAADAPTGLAPAPLIADVGPQSATMAAALAWSSDETPDEPVSQGRPYAYGDYGYGGYDDYDSDDDLSILGGDPPARRGSGLTRSVPLLLGGAAAVAAVAVGGFAYTLTGASTPDTPSAQPVKPAPATVVNSIVTPEAPPPAARTETVTMTNAPVSTVTEQVQAPTQTTVVTVETTTTTPPTPTTTTTTTTTPTTTTTTTPPTTPPTTTTTTPTTTTQWDTTTSTTRRPLIPGLPPPPRIPGLPPAPNLNLG